MSNNENAIEVRELRKSFGEVVALDGIDLEVSRGTILGLLGPNGAGKTTLVRILTTLLKPDAGQAKVLGMDVVGQADTLRSFFGLAGQSVTVDGNLTGLENLELIGKLYHLGTQQAKDRARELFAQFDLTEAGNRLAKTYSGGMRRRLDLALSLVASPPVLFLDEPSSGLDPTGRIELWDVIKRLVALGTTVLLTTQYLDEADRLADQITVINHGRIIASGTPDELKDQVGGDVIELSIKDKSRLGEAAELISQFGVDQPKIDFDNGWVKLSVANGGSVLAEIVRRLDAHQIELEDFLHHRPTLDDVFLALTKQPYESNKQV
ncbi:MAG: ATP-binding cassette domain-containing protein [Candidatus Doudnabacteria bacterium]|nr:ATP-binding cassette domain-containing protein [Candidatus Doudnabacteria bacterium]